MGHRVADYKLRAGAELLEADVSESGLFDLVQLQRLVSKVDERLDLIEDDRSFVIDLSATERWDIAAILWMVIGLHYYKQRGMSFQLVLPQDDSFAKDECGVIDANNSADFLRLWNFDDALQNIDPVPSELLIDEQYSYFSDKKKYSNYKARGEAKSNLLSSFLLMGVLEIRNLVDSRALGKRVVSDKLITNCIEDYHFSGIGDVLNKKCDIPAEISDLISDHLLSEAIMNVKEHPNATIGMVALAFRFDTNELIIAVADNGVSIPDTLRTRFNDDEVLRRIEKCESLTEKGNIVHYATMPGVSSKQELQGDNPIGMGLTYIKNDAVKKFGGSLTVITDSLMAEYNSENIETPIESDWVHKWGGNLLRIAIPLKRW